MKPVDFELESRAFRDDVLAMAARHGVRVEVAAAALADVLAIAAARLDAEGDTCTLADRLHAFCGRVEETYRRAKDHPD
jgi:hypothetical protein